MGHLLKLRRYLLLYAAAFVWQPSIALCAPGDELLSWLRENDTKRVESSLLEVQRSFEAGAITEYELRNSFRPLYVLDTVQLKNLRDWVSARPSSYIAHLLLGIHYKRVGVELRGNKVIAKTPRKDLQLMEQFFRSAEYELRIAMPLIAKPYLNAFHLLDIYGILGDRKQLDDTMEMANAMLPPNELARLRYSLYLTPRWGGAYPELEEFIERSKRQGAPEYVVWELEALKYRDMGNESEFQGDVSSARSLRLRALRLSDRVGESFRSEVLSPLRKQVCGPDAREPECG